MDSEDTIGCILNQSINILDQSVHPHLGSIQTLLYGFVLCILVLPSIVYYSIYLTSIIYSCIILFCISASFAFILLWKYGYLFIGHSVFVVYLIWDP